MVDASPAMSKLLLLPEEEQTLTFQPDHIIAVQLLLLFYEF